MSLFQRHTKECHNCGLIAVELESGAFYQRDCPFCGAKLVDGQKINEGLSYAIAREDEIEQKYIRGDPEKEALYQKRKQSEQRQAEAQLAKREAQRAAQASACVPKCPTCGSTNVQRISTASRLGSTMLFGLASSKIGKTMECKNCGYKW